MIMTSLTFVSRDEKSIHAATARQTKTDVRMNRREICSRTFGMDSKSGTPIHKKAMSEMTTAIAWWGSIIVKILRSQGLINLNTKVLITLCIEHSNVTKMCELCRDKDKDVESASNFDSNDLLESGNARITLISESGLYRILALKLTKDEIDTVVSIDGIICSIDSRDLEADERWLISNEPLRTQRTRILRGWRIS